MTATLDLRPGLVNVKATRGDTIAFPVTIREGGVAANLTGRTYHATLRRFHTSTHAVELVVDTTNAATGQLILRLADTITATLDGDYVWKLVQSVGGSPRTLIAGTWTFA